MEETLVPRPRHLERRDGTLDLGRWPRLQVDPDVLDSTRVLTDLLHRLGITPMVALGDAPETADEVVVRLRLTADGDCLPGGPEAYRIEVTDGRADLLASTPAGMARAVQTFRQLLPSRAAGDRVTVGCCRIDDAPRFGWRGVHLDVARHFMPVHFVRRMIDLAALHRFNVLHLHLTDDQGWRLDVPGRPRLTGVGAWRPFTEHDDGGCDGTPHGGYYTRAELRDIVAFAAERHITVVPEVDMPGHVQAAVTAYPEIGAGGRAPGVRARWGISEHVLNPGPEALAFARDVLAAVTEVFPGPWVHLGGDECPRTQWRADQATVRRASELGLASVDALQSWYLGLLAAELRAAGRQAVGWDEVLDDGGMDTDTVVMAWRSPFQGRRALKAGHRVVMCPQNYTYLDHYQSDDPEEPRALGGLTTLADIAGWEPVPAGWEDREDRVLGVQGLLWTERLPSPEAVEYMAFPRLCALAEVGWTAREARDPDDLLERVKAHLQRLAALSVNFRPLDGPHPWQTGGTGPRRRPAGHGGRLDLPD